MNELTEFAAQVEETAVRLPYPPTPDLHRRAVRRREQSVMTPYRRRLVWAILVIGLMLGSLFFVPQVRAAIVRFFQAGAIGLFVSDGIEQQSEEMITLPQYMSAVGSAVAPAEAQAMMKTPVQLPTQLVSPDQFLVDDPAMPTLLVSLWLDEADPSQVAVSLYQIEVTNFATKGAQMITPTTVAEKEAFWVNGPHVIRLADGSFESWQFVPGNVLIWWDGDVTFRLEGAADMETAVSIAESMQPKPLQ